MGYYGSVFQDGALTSREKSLIALAVAAAARHVHEQPLRAPAYSG